MSNQWISVKDERKPLMGQEVVVLTTSNRREVVAWHDHMTAYNPHVTHWMPLPEPPPPTDPFDDFWNEGKSVDYVARLFGTDTITKRTARIFWDAAVASTKQP